MEAMEELIQLSQSMMQGAALLADEDIDESSPSPSSKRSNTFLNVVVLGNVGAGKSAVLNSLIGHPILPTGENGATRAPISIDLHRDASLSSKAIILQIDNKSQQVSASALRHSLQDRLSKGGAGRSRADEIYLKLRTSTGIYGGKATNRVRMDCLKKLHELVVRQTQDDESQMSRDDILLHLFGEKSGYFGGKGVGKRSPSK